MENALKFTEADREFAKELGIQVIQGSLNLKKCCLSESEIGIVENVLEPDMEVARAIGAEMLANNQNIKTGLFGGSRRLVEKALNDIAA